MLKITYGPNCIQIEGVENLLALVLKRPIYNIASVGWNEQPEQLPIPDPEAPKKRGRPKKITATELLQKLAPVPDPDTTALADFDEPDPPAKVAKPVKRAAPATVNDVILETQRLSKAGKNRELKEILTGLGVGKFSQLKPEHYEAFMDACTEIPT